MLTVSCPLPSPPLLPFSPRHALLRVVSPPNLPPPPLPSQVALTMLRGLEPSNPHYNAAHKVMAELYLTYRNDQRMYAQVMRPPPPSSPAHTATVAHHVVCTHTNTEARAPRDAAPLLSPRR